MNKRWLAIGVAGVMAVATPLLFAQGWTPQKNVEIVVGSAPGGSNDKTARSIEKIVPRRSCCPER